MDRRADWWPCALPLLNNFPLAAGAYSFLSSTVRVTRRSAWAATTVSLWTFFIVVGCGEVVMKEDGYACITTYRHPDMSVTPGPEARKCTRDHSLWPSLSNYSNSSRSISSDLNWKHPSITDDCLRPICAYQSSRTTVISSEPNHDDLYLRTNSFSGLEPLVCLLPTSE